MCVCILPSFLLNNSRANSIENRKKIKEKYMKRIEKEEEKGFGSVYRLSGTDCERKNKQKKKSERGCEME